MGKEIKRFVYLDSVAGLLIIHMIVGHCCQFAKMWTVYREYSQLLFFFMPWFFYKAGMFYRSRSVKEEIENSSRRLLLPFLVFSVLGQCIYYLRLAVENRLTLGRLLGSIKDLALEGSVAGNLPLWFLLSLFIVKVLFNYIHRLKIHRSIRGG